MTMSRRAFLGSATLVTAAAIGGTVLQAPTAAAAATPGSPDALTRATFAPALNRRVGAVSSGMRASLRLVQVSGLPGAAAGSQDSFFLQFTSSRPLPEGIYTVTHPAFGSRQLFLAPVYAVDQRRYEAVVNRTTPPA